MSFFISSRCWADGDPLAHLACPGLIRFPVKMTVPPSFEHLKPYYELHVTSVMRFFDGWTLPKSLDIHLGPISRDGYEDTFESKIFFPILFEKYPNGKPGDHRSTLAGVIHEVAHTVISLEVAQTSPNWKYILERTPTIEAELDEARDRSHELHYKNRWFKTDLDPQSLSPERAAIYPELLRKDAENSAVIREYRILLNYIQFGYASYQEVFSDLIAVLYTEDLSEFTKLIAPGEKGAKFKTAEFRDFNIRYNPSRMDRWETMIRKQIAARDLDYHILFGPARAEIGAIIRSQIKTEFGKRRAAKALAQAINAESQLIPLELFLDLPKVPFRKLNEQLVQAFQKAWDELDRPYRHTR